jgi:hypothetical protein
MILFVLRTSTIFFEDACQEDKMLRLGSAGPVATYAGMSPAFARPSLPTRMRGVRRFF